MLGGPGGLFGGSGPGGARQLNAKPSGSKTGAPTRALFRAIQLPPGTGVNAAVQIVEPERQNRLITLTAPRAAFTVFVGNSGVNANGYSLPAGLPVEIVIPGDQELWAITDAPVILSLLIQVSPILLGDTERE